MCPPAPQKKKQTTTTKLFAKPLKKEGAKSNKKNCKLLGKKPNQWPQKKKKKTPVHPYPLFFEEFQHKELM